MTFWGLFANSKEKCVVKRDPAPPLKAILDVMKLKGIYPLMIIWLVFWLGYGFPVVQGIICIVCLLFNPARTHAKEISAMKARIAAEAENKE